MESEKRAVIAYSDTINVFVSDELLAVGYLLESIGVFDFNDNTSDRVKRLTG